MTTEADGPDTPDQRDMPDMPDMPEIPETPQPPDTLEPRASQEAGPMDRSRSEDGAPTPLEAEPALPTPALGALDTPTLPALTVVEPTGPGPGAPPAEPVDALETVEGGEAARLAPQPNVTGASGASGASGAGGPALVDAALVDAALAPAALAPAASAPDTAEIPEESPALMAVEVAPDFDEAGTVIPVTFEPVGDPPPMLMADAPTYKEEAAPPASVSDVSDVSDVLTNASTSSPAELATPAMPEALASAPDVEGVEASEAPDEAAPGAEFPVIASEADGVATPPEPHDDLAASPEASEADAADEPVAAETPMTAEPDLAAIPDLSAGDLGAPLAAEASAPVETLMAGEGAASEATAPDEPASVEPALGAPVLDEAATLVEPTTSASSAEGDILAAEPLAAGPLLDTSQADPVMYSAPPETLSEQAGETTEIIPTAQALEDGAIAISAPDATTAIGMTIGATGATEMDAAVVDRTDTTASAPLPDGPLSPRRRRALDVALVTALALGVIEIAAGLTLFFSYFQVWAHWRVPGHPASFVGGGAAPVYPIQAVFPPHQGMATPGLTLLAPPLVALITGALALTMRRWTWTTGAVITLIYGAAAVAFGDLTTASILNTTARVRDGGASLGGASGVVMVAAAFALIVTSVVIGALQRRPRRPRRPRRGAPGYKAARDAAMITPPLPR